MMSTVGWLIRWLEGREDNPDQPQPGPSAELRKLSQSFAGILHVCLH